jgi:hypothetical protein
MWSSPYNRLAAMLMVKARIVVLKKKDTTPWTSASARMVRDEVATSAVCEATPII